MKIQFELDFAKPKFTKQNLLSGKNFWVSGSRTLYLFVKEDKEKKSRRGDMILGYIKSRFDATKCNVIEITETYFRLGAETIYFSECTQCKKEIIPEIEKIGRFALVSISPRCNNEL